MDIYDRVECRDVFQNSPQYIKHNFYSDKDWHFRYDIEAMIKFTVVKFFRQQPYRKVVLSEEEAWLLRL